MLPSGMTVDPEKTPSEKLAELVRRKAAATKARGGKAPGVGADERAAAARAASQVKPAPRKG